LPSRQVSWKRRRSAGSPEGVVVIAVVMMSLVLS
jgi:hypothetical protein